MTEDDEDKLLPLRDFMMKLHNSKTNIAESKQESRSPDSRPGALNLTAVLGRTGKVVPLHQDTLVLSVDGQVTVTESSFYETMLFKMNLH